MEIPVYLFTGFLGAGKTYFIQQMLEDTVFNEGERTLWLMCEEGECEPDATRFAAANVFIETIDDASSLTKNVLTRLQQKHKAQRVMVEYNGMWLLQQLYDNMPKDWIIYQEVTFADANTYIMYNANMRNLTVDKLNTPELVVFNCMPKDMDKMPLHKIVRGINRRAEIAYDHGGQDVEYDDIEDPLPFDKAQPSITVEDKDYALWYRDLSEELADYDGKTVTFKGQVVRDKSIPSDCFIIGRPLMTCCADDIRFAGLVCEWERAKTLKNREWVLLTASVTVREHECYGRTGPVLTAGTVQPCDAPENEVATFY